MALPVSSQPNSSDYYDEEDSAFIEALTKAALPGDIVIDPVENLGVFNSQESEELEPPPPAQPCLKRSRLDYEETTHFAPKTSLSGYSLVDQVDRTSSPDLSQELEPPPPTQPSLKRSRLDYQPVEVTADVIGDISIEHDVTTSSQELEPPPPTQPSLKRSRLEAYGERQKSIMADRDPENDDIYGESRFGEIGEYMRRKRAKLQIQNAELESANRSGSTLFNGLSIYINGYTQPSLQDLRKLIVTHGGIFRPYLDKKSIVTHIVTCSLTAVKMREFQNMKVVRPEWLVDSAERGVLLPWRDYVFSQTKRSESALGSKVNQKNLHEISMCSSSPAPPRNTSPPPVLSTKQFGFIQHPQPAMTPVRNNPPPLYQRPRKEMLRPRKPPSRGTEAGKDKSLPVQAPAAQQEQPKPHSRGPESAPVQPVTVTVPAPAPVPRPQAAALPKVVPKYAAHTSNAHAARAMANPEWRKAHTSAAPEFIEGYYKNSRLHHLSAWKAELKHLVQEAQERAEATAAGQLVGKIQSEELGKGASETAGVSMRGAELVMKSPGKGKGKGKGKEKAVDDRVIMHCDFDCFFVSAGLLSRPHLKGKPVVVCHSQGSQGGASSTSEVASASYEARGFGVKNGMSLRQARELCPGIVTIPYEFEKYKNLSLKFYTILMKQADDLQAVSVDEALIDVSSVVFQLRSHSSQAGVDPAKDFAETIRAQVRQATGCEVSIGISHNILLARLATRRAKPAGSYHLVLEDVPEFLAPLCVNDLHGFGASMKQKAQEKLGSVILGDLMDKSKALLCDALGKVVGETLYNSLRGIDDRKLESDKPRKSVSCEINYGIRFEDGQQAEAFIYQMSKEVAKRLDDIGMVGQSITLKIMKRDPKAPVEPPKFLGHGACDLYNKQISLIGPGGRPTSDERVIGEHAYRILRSFNFDPKELRGIGIQIQKLEKPAAAGPSTVQQGMLPFCRLPLPKNGVPPQVAPQINLHPPSDDIPNPEPLKPGVELPSFSQVDMDVFNALPDDVRKELENEYERRSKSPAIVGPPAPGVPPRKDIFPGKIFVPAPNYPRIVRQQRPRSRPVIQPKQDFLLPGIPNHKKKRVRAGASKLPDAALKQLNIDPDVFRGLPPALQHEQLAMLRIIRERGRIPSPPSQRKILKPHKRKPIPAHLLWRPPPPRARWVAQPILRQQGKEKKEKLLFTETSDIQNAIEGWVKTYQHWPPKEKDIEFFTKYLVAAVDGEKHTDVAMERAVAVLKWWLVLLRRHFGGSEYVEEEGHVDLSQGDQVGEMWWKTFREVKQKMDVVAKKRFGGCLSLK
ncbi:hypothetical protein H0H81_010325 [Sphagnurus paluster]|uniref:DNA repair protein REV1 n=1 Tax=Sphagnurus paluster TaxID=117069 RepID=A0A9P7GJ36_9AGAR|nr:hypothetical protein H0H81_010325 [Sphagnurus paluster]